MILAKNGRCLDGAVLAVLLGAILLVQIRGLERPADAAAGGVVAILFAPWTTADTAMLRVAEAGGRIVRFGAFPFIVIAEPDRVDFSERIARQGALAALDPRMLAACLPRREVKP